MAKNKYYCKINGTIYNLSGAQDILDGKSDQNLVMWLYENHIFDDTIDANIFSLVVEFNNGEIPADYEEALKEYQESNRKKSGIPKCFQQTYRCPRCGSTYISKPIWSLYDYKCKTCGHEWVRCPRCGGSNIKITKTPPLCAGKNSFNKCKNCGHDWFRC